MFGDIHLRCNCFTQWCHADYRLSRGNHVRTDWSSDIHPTHYGKEIPDSFLRGAKVYRFTIRLFSSSPRLWVTSLALPELPTHSFDLTDFHSWKKTTMHITLLVTSLWGFIIDKFSTDLSSDSIESDANGSAHFTGSRNDC